MPAAKRSATPVAPAPEREPAAPFAPEAASGADAPLAPEAFPGLAATIRSVPELAELRRAAQPASGPANPPRMSRPSDDTAFTLRLPDAGVRRLWLRLATARPGLEHFSPSPLMATAALETLIGDGVGGGWIEVRRVPGGLTDASGWVIRAHGVGRHGVARLRDIVDGAGTLVPPPMPPDMPARRHLHRHLRPARLALAGVLVSLLGLLAVLGTLALPV